MRELAIENPTAEHLQPTAPDDAYEFDPQPWHELYFTAFDALRCDRFYGSMGGEGPIYYTAISRYARDHRITGVDFWLFNIFMNAVDGEYLEIRAEEIEKQAKAPKGN
jgi:hypothetical protein